MHYSSFSATTSGCMQYIVNLHIDKHFATCKIYQTIECLCSLLEHNGLQDLHLNFEIEPALLNENIYSGSHNGYPILSYNTRHLQNLNETLFFSCLQGIPSIVRWQLGP